MSFEEKCAPFVVALLGKSVWSDIYGRFRSHNINLLHDVFLHILEPSVQVLMGHYHAWLVQPL